MLNLGYKSQPMTSLHHLHLMPTIRCLDTNNGGPDAIYVCRITTEMNATTTTAHGCGTNWWAQTSERAKSWECVNIADPLETYLITFVVVALPAPRGTAGVVVATKTLGSTSTVFLPPARTTMQTIMLPELHMNAHRLLIAGLGGPNATSALSITTAIRAPTTSARKSGTRLSWRE